RSLGGRRSRRPARPRRSCRRRAIGCRAPDIADAGPTIAGRAGRLRLGLDARLVSRTARNVGVLAACPPATARPRAVSEADGIAQFVELVLRQLARVADPQIVKRQVRERDPLQLVDAVAERFEHAMDLALLALEDRDREPGVLALAGQHRDLGG